MEEFSFSETFNGMQFYRQYQNALFLKDEENLRTILLRSDELEKRYKSLQPGTSLAIKGMWLASKVQLVITKSQLIDESDVEKEKFTLRRLLGLVAAYVHSHYDKTRWCNFYSVESERCGLSPDSNTNQVHMYQNIKNKPAYYSAVSGAEYFYEIFGYNPFLFALLKFQRNQISEELLLVIANIRDNTMQSLVMRCSQDFANAQNTASQIGFQLHEAIRKAPQDIKCFFNKSNQYY